MANGMPVARRIPTSSSQGKGMRLVRFTARSAVEITAAMPAVTRFFNQEDNNGDPAAGEVFQLSKGAFNRGEVADFNFVNIQRVGMILRYAAAPVGLPTDDVRALGASVLQLSRQSDQNFLEFSGRQTFDHTENFDVDGSAAATFNVFPNGIGYDIADGGRFAEDVKVNSPTIGNAIAQFNFPGIWLVPGPFQFTLQPGEGLDTLTADLVVEFYLKGYLLQTNIS